jgi:hypothetical protein
MLVERDRVITRQRQSICDLKKEIMDLEYQLNMRATNGEGSTDVLTAVPPRGIEDLAFVTTAANLLSHLAVKLEEHRKTDEECVVEGISIPQPRDTEGIIEELVKQAHGYRSRMLRRYTPA